MDIETTQCHVKLSSMMGSTFMMSIHLSHLLTCCNGCQLSLGVNEETGFSVFRMASKTNMLIHHIKYIHIIQSLNSLVNSLA